MTAIVNETHIDHKNIKGPKMVNMEALYQIIAINRQLETELQKDQAPKIAELSHFFGQLYTQLAQLNLPNDEAAAKIEELVQLFPKEAFHHPQRVNLESAKEKLGDLKDLRGKEDAVVQVFENFVALFGEVKTPPNVQNSILDLTRKFETERSQKAMSDAQNKLAEIEGRVSDLQTILDEMQSDDPQKTTFEITELSNEWAKLTQLLKEIPPSASLYVRKQAEKLLALMETCDITGPLDEKTCKKLTTEVQRLLEGSQKEYPEVTRALELTMHLVTMFQKMVDFMAREDRHGRRTFSQNCKV